MLLRISLFVGMWMTSVIVVAQYNAYWIEGKVTFKNGETQYCLLNYDGTVPEGLLRVKDGKKTLTYTVRDVESFSFFDDYTEQWRKFYTFPLYLVKGGVVRPFFMELVYRGSRWSILRKKERWVGSRTYQVLSPENRILQRPEKKLKYARYYEICYMLDMHSGQLEELTPQLLFSSVKDEKHEMRRFVKENRLRFRTVEEYVSLLDYYHQLTLASDNHSGFTRPAGTVPVE